MNCKIHNELMTQRQSKTKFEEDGSPKTYFAHNLEKGLCFGRPPKDQAEFNQPVTRSTNSRSGEESPDWDEIARGKTRCAIFCAIVEKDGLALALESKNKIELAVSFVINGLGSEEPEF